MVVSCAEIDIVKLIELHGLGYTDTDIAKNLEISRRTVARRRKDLGLLPNRKVGVRGISVSEDESYWLLARRAVQHVGHYLGRAAREYYEETGDWDRYFISLVMEPKPMFHPTPGPYVTEAEKMNYKHVTYITDYEKSVEHMGIAGVPGPALLQLIKCSKNEDKSICRDLAREAVETAGFVTTTATVREIEVVGCITPEDYREYWEEQKSLALDWTPVKDWGRQIETVYRSYEQYNTGTGKRGRGGNITNVKTTQTFLGIDGY